MERSFLFWRRAWRRNAPRFQVGSTARRREEAERERSLNENHGFVPSSQREEEGFDRSTIGVKRARFDRAAAALRSLERAAWRMLALRAARGRREGGKYRELARDPRIAQPVLLEYRCSRGSIEPAI